MLPPLPVEQTVPFAIFLWMLVDGIKEFADNFGLRLGGKVVLLIAATLATVLVFVYHRLLNAQVITTEMNAALVVIVLTLSAGGIHRNIKKFGGNSNV